MVSFLYPPDRQVSPIDVYILSPDAWVRFFDDCHWLMVVMGIHVRHVRHRAGPVVAMTFVSLIVVVSTMFVVVPVVVSPGGGAD